MQLSRIYSFQIGNRSSFFVTAIFKQEYKNFVMSLQKRIQD